MTREEAVTMAGELSEYRAKSMVACGRVLAQWTLAREDRLNVILRRAEEAVAAATDPEVRHALEQLIAEVRA